MVCASEGNTEPTEKNKHITLMNNNQLTLEQLQTIAGGYYMDENGYGCIDPRLVDIMKKMGWDPRKTLGLPSQRLHEVKS